VGSPIPEIPFVAPATKNVTAIPANNKMSMRRVCAVPQVSSRWISRKLTSAKPKWPDENSPRTDEGHGCFWLRIQPVDATISLYISAGFGRCARRHACISTWVAR
jgi:hypothetical protein